MNRIRLLNGIIVLLTSIQISFAQSTLPAGLLQASVDPQGDSLFFAKTRAMMDSIRRTEERPTVGLVLAGGGAKGAATIGVLKYLEDINMPIDLITGTSIGGLLGALYSIGYSADDLKEIMATADWNAIMKDEIDKKYIPYITKDYKNKHMLTIRFNMGQNVFSSVKGGERNFRQSLPSGMIEGFNVNKLIRSLTIGYQDDMSFADFSIPFACTAGDLVTNKEMNFTSGELPIAMRSTMAIPGLFDPVEYNSMVLVDGGVKNNIPVDLAKAMGADYTIVVSLVQEKKAPEQMNIANIAGSLLEMLTYATIEDSKKMSDIYINPVLPNAGMLSFNKEAIDEAYETGYASAVQYKPELMKLKEIIGDSKKQIEPQKKAVNLNKTPISVSGVRFEGIDAKTEFILNKKFLKLHKKSHEDKITMDELDWVLNTLKSSGVFQDVCFSLTGVAEPYELVIHCKPMPKNRFGFGARIDNDAWVELLLNVGINTNLLRGSSLDVSANIGSILNFTARYSYKFINFPSFYLDYSNSRINPNVWWPSSVNEDRIVLGSDITTHTERAYFSLASNRYFQFDAGLMYRSTTVDKKCQLWSTFFNPDDINRRGYLGIFLNMNFDNLNDKYFPTKGNHLKIMTNWEFFSPQDNAFKPIMSSGLDYTGAFSIGKSVTFLPKLSLRRVMNKNAYSSFIHMNYFGGEYSGRYTPLQTSFFGVNGIAMSLPWMTTFELESRVKVYKKLYVSALVGILKQAWDFSFYTSTLKHDFYSAGVQLSYDSFVGPVKLNYHYTNGIGSEVYFSIGYHF